VPAQAQGGGFAAMTGETESAQVSQIAFAAAFDHGDDVIGVPKAAAVQAAKAPPGKQREAMPATGAAQVRVSDSRVDATKRTDAVVALPDLVAQIGGVGTQAPFVDAPLGTKSESPAWNFEAAPAAKRAVIGAALELVAFGEAAGHGASSAHERQKQFHYKLFCGEVWPQMKRRERARAPCCES